MEVLLSPPWYTLRNMIAYTIGESPYIRVAELVEDGNTGYDLNIYVKSSEIAKAVRVILPLTYQFQEVIIQVIVHDICKGVVVNHSNEAYETPAQLANVFCTALMCNKLFVGTILTEGKVNPAESDILGDVVIVIAKEIVQFFNDDLSNICNDFNEIAANVFSEIIINEYPIDLKISFSTYNHNCIKPQDLYCTN